MMDQCAWTSGSDGEAACGDEDHYVNSAITAFAKGAQWENALGPQAAMAHQTVEVNIITYNPAISAFAKDAQWKTVFAIAREVM